LTTTASAILTAEAEADGIIHAGWGCVNSSFPKSIALPSFFRLIREIRVQKLEIPDFEKAMSIGKAAVESVCDGIQFLKAYG
jgi:hypothetical protein